MYTSPASRRPPTTVPSEIRRYAEECPSRSALVASSSPSRWETWTYQDLDRESDAFAAGFVRLGVRPGDRVLVGLEPSHEAFAVVLGLWRMGAVAAWPDPRLSTREILAFADHVEPRVAIARPRLQNRLRSVELAITVGRRWFRRGPSLRRCRVPGAPVGVEERSPADEALIVTSLASGVPLPVVCLQTQLTARAAALTRILGEAHRRTVHTDPMLALVDLCLGGTVILARTGPHGVRVGDLVAAVRDHAADVAFASVEAWGDVARYGLETRLRLPSLETVVVVDGGVAPPLHRRLERLRRVLDPHCRVLAIHGTPEAFPVAAIDTGDSFGETWERTVRGAGRCLGPTNPDLFVRIVPVADDPLHHWHSGLALGVGDVGEIVVGGTAVSPAYASLEANRQCKIAYGSQVLHRTGRLGTLDEQGRLWVMGSKEDRIRLLDGTLIVPEVLEAMIDAHKDVERSALVAIGPNADLLVLCVETPSWQTFGPETERSLHQIAARFGCRIVRIRPIERLPIEPRRGAVLREEIRRWVHQTWDDGETESGWMARPA